MTTTLHRLSVSITKEQYQALCTIARRRHTSLSQVIREALNNLEQS